MTFTQHYDSPLGGILLAADETGLTGLWFDGQKYFARDLPIQHTEQDTPVLSETRRWLDMYFTGREPDFLPPLHPQAPRSAAACGICFSASPTARPSPMASWRSSWPRSRTSPICPLRQWAAR